jgi:hypothetical protein
MMRSPIKAAILSPFSGVNENGEPSGSRAGASTAKVWKGYRVFFGDSFIRIPTFSESRSLLTRTFRIGSLKIAYE